MIDLDASKSAELVKLSQHGQIEARTLDGVDEHAVSDALVRPGRTRASAFAIEVLSRCTDLTRAEVQALTGRQRDRLTVAVVRVNDWQQDWTALYGSHLSADERLLAVASWDYQRSSSAALTRLREIRRQHLQDAERRTAALGAAQLAPISEAMAKAQCLVAGHQQAVQRANALSNFHKFIGNGGAMQGLLATTRPNLALAVFTNPPWSLRAVMPSPSPAVALRGVSGFSDAVLGLDRTRAAVASVTRGLTLPKSMYGRFDVPRYAVPSAMLSPGLVNALAGTKTMLGISDSLRAISSGLLGAAVSARLTNALLPPARLGIFHNWQDQFADTWAALDEFLAAWENEALWYLFSTLSIGASAKLGRLRRDEVETVVFDALEQVFTDPELLEAFIAQLDLVPDLAGPHRDQMRQALQFVRTGDYHLAQPLLHVAFESMLYQGALRRGVIQPRVEGKFSAAEGLLKLLFASGDLFLNFTLRMVFGGVGNSYRHGRNSNGHRELMLAGMVALGGYIDWTTGTHAIEIVAKQMERQLGPAIERLETKRQALLTASG